MDNNQNELETPKKGNNSVIIIAVLVVLVLVLAGLLLLGGGASKDNNNTSNNTNNVNNDTKYTSYNIGDQVTVKLNDSTEATFYVLKQSSETEEVVTLLADRNIGGGAFNNNFTDGNEYNGSLIQSNLNELTSSWTNVKVKRLITLDEIRGTGLSTTEQCGPSESSYPCDKINEESWLRHSDEGYWTMTKSENDSDNRYVYFVDMMGDIRAQIVGYEPGGDQNPDGTFFQNYGIRPVIEISKNYVK